MKIEFEYLNDSTYYDQSGLGLQLTINSNLYTITDALGNKMVFKNERLIKTISCESNQITKLYEYDNVGKLIKAYDERTPDTRFEFKYDEDNYLCEVETYIKNKLKYKFKYIYDTNNNLIAIKKEQNKMLTISK